MSGGSSIPAAPVTDDGPSEAQPGSRSALVENLERAAQEPEPVDSVTEQGTDSVATVATAVTLAQIDAATRERLERFGRLFLGYDHREPAQERAAALEPLVTAALLAHLMAPLPPALVAQLATEERVVVATLTDVEAVERRTDGGTVLRAFYNVTTSTVSDDDGDPIIESASQAITVITDPAGLIEDVR